MFILRSLWDRHRPGHCPVSRHIRFEQWTPIHLTPPQRAAGIIPLRHIARILLFDRPSGLTWVRGLGGTYWAERIADALVVPPSLLTDPVVYLRHLGEGFALRTGAPNLVATQQFLRALGDAGWSEATDLFDDEGRWVLPALVRATRANPSVRHQLTIPLTLVPLLGSRSHHHQASLADALVGMTHPE